MNKTVMCRFVSLTSQITYDIIRSPIIPGRLILALEFIEGKFLHIPSWYFQILVNILEILHDALTIIMCPALHRNDRWQLLKI